MNDSLSAYKIWAPDDALWTVWAKPVLFANTTFNYSYILAIPDEIHWIEEIGSNNDTMIILDMPGESGVEEGLALARKGFRPVPLYNGVNGPDRASMAVDVRNIASALFQGADILSGLDLKSDAPPVFLLDSNRMQGAKKERGKYDNRWCVFPQDMPSADFLTKHGIKKIIVQYIQNDLSHILCRYQEQGIKIHLVDISGSFREVKVTPPSIFESMIYRFKMITGLTRNATGGFGGQIPDQVQHQSSGGMFYYRMG